jgi:hypothetical protein
MSPARAALGYDAVPLEEIDIDAEPPASPSRSRHAHRRSDHFHGLSRPAAWRRRILLIFASLVAFVLFYRLEGPRKKDEAWDNLLDYSRPVAWGLADEGLRTAWLPPPNQNVRFSVIQAAIRSEATTYRDANLSPYYLSILAFYERACSCLCCLAPSKSATEPITERLPETWQSFVKDPALLGRITCTFRNPNLDLAATTPAWTRIPSPGWALFINCPIRESWHVPLGLNATSGRTPARRLEVMLNVDVRDSTESTTFSLPLRPYHPPRPAPQQVGVCIAPRWGGLRFPDMLQWRAHHSLLGVGPVHWYGRDGAHADTMATFVDRLARDAGAVHDTFRLAPAISPEVYNTSLLEADGLYADQVLYAADCLLRSLYLAPTPWLALIDLDELFLPDPFSSSDPATWSRPLHDLLASQPVDVASLQLMRTHPVGPTLDLAADVRPSSAALFLAELNHYRPPRPQDHCTSAWRAGSKSMLANRDAQGTTARAYTASTPSSSPPFTAPSTSSLARPATRPFALPASTPVPFASSTSATKCAPSCPSPPRSPLMSPQFGDGPFDDVYDFSPGLHAFARALSNATEALAARLLDDRGQLLP